MAAHIPTAAEIRSSVLKDGTERLKSELRDSFPSLEAEVVAGVTRYELVELVIEMRTFLHQKTKVQEVLEGKLELKLPQRFVKVSPGVQPERGAETVPLPSSPGAMNPADVMALFMQMMQQQRDEETKRRKEETELRKRELEIQENLRREESAKQETLRREESARQETLRREELAIKQRAEEAKEIRGKKI